MPLAVISLKIVTLLLDSSILLNLAKINSFSERYYEKKKLVFEGIVEADNRQAIYSPQITSE